MSIDEYDSVRSLLSAVIDSPEESLRYAPLLLDLVEDDRPENRVSAAWGLCLIVEAHPDVAETIADRVEDRESTAAWLTLAWLAEQHGVDAPVGTVDGRGEETADVESDQGPEDAQESEASVTTREATTPGGSGSTFSVESSPVSTGDADAEDNESAPGGTDADWSRTDPIRGEKDVEYAGDPIAADQVVINGRFMADLEGSDVESVQIVEGVERSPYTKIYSGEARIAGDPRAVLLRVFVPPDSVPFATFGRYFDRALADWSRIDDHDHVLSVYEWGRNPNPWAVLGYATETLRSIDRLDTSTALRCGLDAATAIAHAHEAGVTHLTLDPRCVAFDRRNSRPETRVLNFGIAEVFWNVDGPIPIDPRYAAPEYFDDAFGDRDWMTDVYQLGAVLYTLLTGHPPYERSELDEGAPTAVELTPPTEVADDVPPEFDRIVAKAMSIYKIARYESVDEVARDLQGLVEEYGDEP